MRPGVCLIIALSAFFGALASSRADTVIVVDSGNHRSADVSGHNERKTNWLDADTRDDIRCTEGFAALELQEFLQKMTRRPNDFDVVKVDAPLKNEELILVGGPQTNAVTAREAARLGLNAKQLEELGPEGYRLVSRVIDGRRVTVIAGGGRVGTLYAAYDLLHRLGYRWYAPGKLYEECPRIEGIPDLDVTERPSFSVRRFHSWEDRVDPGEEFLLWMARNRLNSWTIVDDKAPLMRKLGIQMSCGSHSAESHFLNPHGPYPYNHSQFLADKKKRSDPYPLSEQFRGDADKDGALSNFEAHPEWFAEVGKRRTPGIEGTRGVNFCTSNADAVNEFIRNYVQAIITGRYQQGDVILFWTLDSGGPRNSNWCECEQCRALGTPTDRYLRLVHQFDQEIKRAQAAHKINRPMLVKFMIYRDVIQPPTRPLPEGFDYSTCVGTYFPAVHCYEHHFDDPHCSVNAEFQKTLTQWTQAADRYYRGVVGIGEYYNIHRFRCLPLCLMHSMQHDIPYFYKECGSRQFDYMHVTTENWGNKSLTNYQMARQLWNVDVDCEDVWRDYFAGRYGSAAATMRAFYEALEKVDFHDIKSSLALQLSKGSQTLFPTTHLRYDREPGVATEGATFVENVVAVKACRELIDQALAADAPERIKTRIAEDERLFAYGERTVAYYNALVQTIRAERAGNRDEALRQLADARRFADLLRQDTTSVQFSWDHLKATNALDASNCAAVVDALAKKLGPPPLGATK